MTPYRHHARLEFGREIHRIHSEEVPLSLEGMKLDRFREDSGVVVEIKSTSRHLESARAQVAYYLYRLREVGVRAGGEIWVPEEGLKEKVEGFSEEEVGKDLERIKHIVEMERPPPRKWIRYCGKCAYRGLCWGEER
ncbi:Dna2/Cas4 domain-containing protein [Sulfodiicoccus acidiphilus]|uniref:Dna2/Cas4 domain-containing protein n=1 Tax=Sulfodiicoccus acidiphilus TaxID=1670455 RepID=UPI000F833908|nr:Dna2/Cas4 domain-containing protein [Sulfodiicoccus acidiphilus]